MTEAPVSGRVMTLYSPPYAPPALPHFSVAPVSREAADASTPPMLKHWREVKAQHPETILFYRVGDFYEMFHEDAQLAARVLEITLTSRGDGVPLAGVPVKAAADYLRQLIGAGHRVAICEQVEDPKLAKGLVRREVVETVTPGAMLQEGWLAGGKNNFLVAVGRDRRSGSGSRPSISAPASSCSRPWTRPASPRRSAGSARPRWWCRPTRRSPAGDGVLRTVRERWEFDPDLAREELARRFALATLDGLGVGPDDGPAIGAAGRAAPLSHRAAAVGPAAPRPAVRAPERRVPLARRDDPPESRAGRAAPGRRARLHAARDDRRHRHPDGRPPASAVAALAAPRSGGDRLPARRGRGDGARRPRARAAPRGARRRARRRAAGRPRRGGPGHPARARRAARLVPPPARRVGGAERARGLDPARRRPRGRAGRRGGRARPAGRPGLRARPRPRGAAAGATGRRRRDPGRATTPSSTSCARSATAAGSTSPRCSSASASGPASRRSRSASTRSSGTTSRSPTPTPRGCRPTTSGGRRSPRPSGT